MTATPATARRWPVISALGIVEIFTWGSSFYLMTVLAKPIAAQTGWSLSSVIGALSAALLAAGLASPAVGAAITRHSGRDVLAAGCVLLAAGLFVVALSPSIWVFYAGWLLIGCGMAAGLYDPAFATLTQLYGRDARSAITALTLWGGFASTVCWPITTLLLETFGWRGTAAAYAVLHLCGTLPLVLWGIPRPTRTSEAHRAAPLPDIALEGAERAAFALMVALLVLAGLVSANLTVHLLTLLQAQGYTLAAAVALGTLFGPAQVAARVVEMAGGGRYHPIWTMAVAMVAIGTGVILLAANMGLAGVALVLFGAGNGLFSIARGALPLAIFGPERYARIMGRLARPALLAQAAAPVLGATAIQWFGAATTLGVICILAVTNLAIALGLWRLLRRVA